jgi:hypothetical protein
MDCETARAQSADRLTGTLGPDATAALDEHLRSCPACARETDGLTDTWALLERIPADEPNSAAMRARLSELIDPPARARRWWIAPALQAAAAVVLVAGGFAIGRHSAPMPQPDPAISELRDELHATREMVSLSLLQQQSASERLRGITYTSQIDRPGSEVVSALLDTLMHDPDVNVRVKSIDALKRFADRHDVRQAATKALTGPASSPLVQIALIDFLIEANDRESLTSLRQVAQDAMADRSVRARAAWGLQHIG